MKQIKGYSMKEDLACQVYVSGKRFQAFPTHSAHNTTYVNFEGVGLCVSGPSAKLHCKMVPLKAHIWDWPWQLDAVLL